MAREKPGKCARPVVMSPAPTTAIRILARVFRPSFWPSFRPPSSWADGTTRIHATLGHIRRHRKNAPSLPAGGAVAVAECRF